jgi:YVTN family beta-propeller protein
VTVGSNPTAVAAYPAPPEGSYSSSTAMRAVVANSGSNTISILDILDDKVLSTIAVGNQPVALAVSSDGSTAYVANYSDSTVTRVNLTTYTQTGTVAVGGHPTSVALTAAGTLWVGGMGFLSQVNAQTMAVTATETTSKTIASLGYSDQVGQIVAVAADNNGNVYDDQLNPANVTAGGTYTPANSVMVSSLGTHLNASTNQYVRAFTDTLARKPELNLNQTGGPPLVVYDAWVAVTATPTGFTITDIADNYVFDSVPTPSPVTAIAVDHNLNVAYLAMPDSNLVLTVPLPGIPASSSPVTAAPSNKGTYTNEGSQEIVFTLTLYDDTPGATIYYQTSCPSDEGEESSGGSFDVFFQVYSGCNPSGTMYAQAPGLLPSATVSIDFP